MYTGLLWQVIFWLGLPLLAMLIIVLIRRKIAGKFPFFFSYIAAGFVIDLIRRFTLRSRPPIYFYVYWISDVVSTLLALLATSELILVRLFPRFYKVRFYRYLFSFAGIVIACLNAAAFLIAFSVRTKYLAAFTDTLPVFAYDAACLIWLIAFMRTPQSVPASTDSQQREIIQKARKWEETLKDSVSGKKDQ